MTNDLVQDLNAGDVVPLHVITARDFGETPCCYCGRSDQWPDGYIWGQAPVNVCSSCEYALLREIMADDGTGL